MTTVLHIQAVTSRSKIDTLREFGHRVFVELGDDGKPIGYFVERRPDVAAAQLSRKVRAGTRPVVRGNEMLVWTGKREKFRLGSISDRVYMHAIDLTAQPSKRATLEDVIAKQTKLTPHQVQQVTSNLIGRGVLKVTEG